MNGKIPALIRWNRSDYAKLSYAVRQFNKKVNELEQMGVEYTPEEYNYKDLKSDIYSRKELNRIIKSLKRFSTRETQQRLIEIPSGEKITNWEYQELKKAQKRASNYITEKARGIVESDTNVMGDREFRQLMRTKESISDLFGRSGNDFKITKERALAWGRSDYELRRADVFRDNFMKALDEMKNYDNFNVLYNKLKSIKNPVQFYNYIQQSETLQDIFLYYKDEANAQTYGGFKNNQNAFNKAIEDLGLREFTNIDIE